jgi:tetratricopeptide (TPR) repeat protein
MTIRKALAAILAALTLTTPALASVSDAAQQKAESRAEAEADLYESGTDAVDEGDWEQAIRDFARVVEMKGSRADGALYWTAYALNKLSRRTEAVRTIEALKKSYPQSRWLNDAQALELELRQARGETVKPEDVRDDELKMIALNSLMYSDPEKAYPLLEKILRSGSSTKKMQERALFILSQSPSPRAFALIGEIARGTASPALQQEAVRFLGVNATERNRQLLSEVYASTASTPVKKSVLQAFMIAGDRERVIAAAKGESNPALRETAIELLGVMGARADLAAMYAGETSRSAREKILQALFIAGDTDRLATLAKSEKDRDLRVQAIRNLALTGSKSTPSLLALYASESDPEIREAVIEGLFVQGNARALIDLSKKETDKRLKREILEKLSIMDSDEAAKYMMEILDE